MPYTNADIAKLIADHFPEVFDVHGGPGGPPEQTIIWGDYGQEGFTIRFYGDLDAKRLLTFTDKLEGLCNADADISIQPCCENTDFLRVDFDLKRG